ncbi:MAG: hypothetical protein JWL98_1666 [Xanthomonadaceae bacterium]|nr:hypothetical protein [Xanthomonadaceae bacterium]
MQLARMNSGFRQATFACMTNALSTERGTLWTIGHSTRDWPTFVAMLAEHGIGCLVDVRRFAGSRRNPQYFPAAMAPALHAEGIAYLPMPELGGRRTPQPDSPNGAWRVSAFRGYADYMATDDYVSARQRLTTQAASGHCVVMCAEALWWRCHRRLIADDFVARDWQVIHAMAPGKLQAHPLNPAAVLRDDVLQYPAAADAQSRLF